MDTDADLKGVVVEMAEHVAENLPPSEQLGFQHVIKMVRDGTVSAKFLSQMLKEMKKNRIVLRAQVRGLVPLHTVKGTGRLGHKEKAKVNFLGRKFHKEKENKVSNLMFHKEKENKVFNLMFHKEKENKVSNQIFHKEKENKVSNQIFHKEKEKGKKDKENNIHRRSSASRPVCRCGLAVGVKDLRAKKKGRKAKEDITMSGESSQTVVRKRNTI